MVITAAKNKRHRQSTVDNFVTTTTKSQQKSLDNAVAKFYYGCNIAFNIAEHELWKDMIEALRPGYSPPSRKQLANDKLDEVYNEVREKIKTDISGKQVTLMQDGWSDIHNSPVIATAVHCEGQQHFISSLDCGANHKTAEYCTQVASDAIKMLKEEFSAQVIGVVTDNENKMKAVRKKLKELHKEVTAYGCSSHYLNLLGQELTNPDVIKHVTAVNKYFRNHHTPGALLENQTGSVKPQIPGATRWNSQLTCLETYIRNRPYMSLVCNGDNNIDTNIVQKVNDAYLYMQAQDLATNLKPVAKALDRTQANDCNMAECCEIWLSLRDTLGESPDITESMKTAILKRFDEAVTPNHLLANMLDPRYLGRNLTVDDENSAEGVIAEINSDIMPLLYAFAAKGQPFPAHFFEDTMRLGTPPSIWWRTLQRKLRNSAGIGELAKISCQLNKFPASSAAIERVFSSFGLVQTRLRNRLSLEKTAKLVTCYRNLRDMSIEIENVEELMESAMECCEQSVE